MKTAAGLAPRQHKHLPLSPAEELHFPFCQTTGAKITELPATCFTGALSGGFSADGGEGYTDYNGTMYTMYNDYSVQGHTALTHTETNIFTFHYTVNSEKNKQQLSAVNKTAWTSRINYYKIRRLLLPHSESHY